MPQLWSVRYWQELFLYFFAFSVAGYFFEVSWTWTFHVLFGRPLSLPIMLTIIPQAAPYGLGIVSIVLIVIPLMKQYRLNPVVVFVLSGLVATVVEYICALVVVTLYGYNEFWNYSSLPLNIHGYVSIGSSFVFAVLAIIFIYGLYPACEKLLRKVSANRINALFWLLVGIYIANLVISYFINGFCPEYAFYA